jgi:membrane-bound lytic murein transglycosylase D
MVFSSDFWKANFIFAMLIFSSCYTANIATNNNVPEFSVEDTTSKTEEQLPEVNVEEPTNNTADLFDLLFTEAKSYYVDALIASYYQDTTEAKYCFDRTFEVIAEISDLDTLTILQQDDFNRFCEKLSYDLQTDHSYINGDSGTFNVAKIREELSEIILDTVKIGSEKIIVLEDKPGHLPIVTSEKIESIINYYSTRGRKSFQEWLDNSGLYREHMLPILREYGVPDELFYLALIESGYNPAAYSYAHAAGPWQFIASTGARYGLTRNWWIDERRDPIKSTYAAAEYLSKLYEEFNDWFLALAAYNCGELRVWRAIRIEGTRDFWKLKTLPKETRNYIPTLMAGIIIAQNPEKYGFENNPKPTWEWDGVVVDRCYEFEDIAKIAKIPTDVLQQYNPELRRWATPPDAKDYVLRVPNGKGEYLSEKLAEIPDSDDKPQFVNHRVTRGQNLTYIARKYGTTVSAIVSANNITNKNQIKIGQILRIPTSNYYSSSQDVVVHTVRKGETLYEIARLYNSSISKIRSVNGLWGKRYIYPGQKLQIPTNKSSITHDITPSGKKKIVHVVKKGETLSEIAEQYNVGLSKVRTWNNLSGRFIYPGQKIVIYKSVES